MGIRCFSKEVIKKSTDRIGSNNTQGRENQGN